MAAFETAMGEALGDERIIVGVDTLETSLVVRIEGGGTVPVGRSLFSSIIPLPDEWAIEFHVRRLGTSFRLPSQGIDFAVRESGSPPEDFPLVQPVTATLPHPGRIRYTVHGRSGPGGDLTSPGLQLDSTGLFTVVGLYPGERNGVTLEYLGPEDRVRAEKWIEIHRDSIPLLPAVEVVRSPPAAPGGDHLYLTAYRNTHRPIVLDSNGDVRWYADMTASYALQQTVDGTLLFTDTEFVYRVSLQGDVLRTYELPAPYTNVHHDVHEIQNGDLVLTVNKSTLPTIEDVLVLLDGQLGTVTREWDLNASIPRNYSLIHDTIDWVHVNAVAVDERDRGLLVSGQRRGLFKVSWENELLWVISDPRGFAPTVPLLDIEGDVFWGQHDIRIDERNDTYYVFDNGLGRSYSGQNAFSRGVRFTVDEAAMTAGIEAEFGREFPEYFSPIISGIDFGDDGQVLMNFGSLGYNFEYQDSTDIRGPGPLIRSEAEYGAALVEYDAAGAVVGHMRLSAELDSGLDPGVYRARFVDLFAPWR